ncbi:MAG: methylmalonyl-CoA mutase family protein [Leptonema sp. (in: bacteria)]
MDSKQNHLSEYYPEEHIKLFDEFPKFTKEEWIEEIYKTLEKFKKPKDLEVISWKTYDGMKILPFYIKEDISDLAFVYEYPGVYPFLRSRKTNQSWEILQYLQGSEEEVQEKIEQTTRRGAEGIMIPFGKKSYPYIFYGNSLANSNFIKNIINKYQFSYYFLGESKELIELMQLQNENLTFLIDPFLELLIEGEFSDSYTYILKEIQNKNPNYPCLSVRGDLYAKMGIPIAMELGLTISHFAEMLCQLNFENTSELIAWLPKITLVQSTGSYYFLEIAKLRATRRLLALVLSGFGINEYKSPPKQLMVTSDWNHSIYDIYNNLLRNTISTMAGIIGGVDSIVVLPFTSVNNYDDEFSRRLAVNTQLILKYECHLDSVVDPAGGSYYIENITNLLSEKAWEYFLNIEKEGGFLESIRKNYIFSLIEEKQQEIIKNIKSRKEFILGVNQYPNPKDFLLNEYKEFNLIGKYDPTKKIKFFRAPIFFEELRIKTEELSKLKGVPVIQLIPFGKLAQQRARASFIMNFFVSAGFIVDDPGDLKNKETILQFLKEITYREHLIKSFVLCSSDEEYLSMFLVIKEVILAFKVPVLIAGLPDNFEELKSLGIFDFIHLKSNLYETLLKYQKLFLES